MSFAEPDRLWLLLLPAGAALLAMLRHRRRLGQQRRLASPAVWQRVMGGVPATGLVRLLAWAAAAALLVLALARPQWGELPREVSLRTRDLVVAVDVSDSMRCPDVAPSRLQRGLREVARALPGLDGNRVGVVVFAGDAYPLVPLTTDLNAVATFLEAVEPGMVGQPGSNLQRAVAASLELLPEEGEGRVVVVISDGENLQGDVEAAADALRQAGARLVAMVTGTEGGGPIPMAAARGEVRYKRDRQGQPVITRARREVLAELADAADGEVLEASDRHGSVELVASVQRLRTREAEVEQGVRKVDRFPVFLVTAVLAVVAAFVVPPWRRSAALLVVLLALAAPSAAQGPTAAPPETGARPQEAEAAPGDGGDGVAWWQRLLPGGSRRLARAGSASWRDGDVEQAARRFRGAAELAPSSPVRLFDYGTALAATGRLEESAAVLAAAAQQGADNAAYNQGTAALQAGDARGAVQWLRQALLADADDPDAKRNYELALRMLQEESQQQQDEQEEQEDQQQDQQQEDEQQEQQPQQAQGPEPTPTPDLSDALYAALERADREAREAMRTPTPQASSVEKDW